MGKDGQFNSIIFEKSQVSCFYNMSVYRHTSSLPFVFKYMHAFIPILYTGMRVAYHDRVLIGVIV